MSDELNDIFGVPRLLQHLDRLKTWQSTGSAYPVMVSIDLTNLCNHDCPMCNSSKGQRTDSMPFERLKELIHEFAQLGVRGISFGGGGDCTTYKHLSEVIRLIHSLGMDSGMYTNGQLLREADLDTIVASSSWIRVSLDADSPELHAVTHGTKGRDFDKVVSNIGKLVQKRNATDSKLTVGTGFLVGSHTKQGIYGAVKLARDLGVDYMRLRPFYHFDGKDPFRADEVQDILAELTRAKSDLETDRFKVTFPEHRTSWVSEGERPKIKTKCNVHHFSTIVEADFKMYICYHFKGFEKYCIGDLSNASLAEVWASQKRKDVYESINYLECARPCNMQVHNTLLEMVEHAPLHSNFL